MNASKPTPMYPKAILFKITLTAVALLILRPLVGNAAMEVTPRVSTGVEYTDNFFLTSGDSGSKKESEWSSIITPGIMLDISGRTADLSLHYDPSYTKYDKFSKDDYWAHAAGLASDWRPTRHLSLELTDDYLKTEDPIFKEDLTLRRSRQPYTTNTSKMHISQQFGKEDTLFADGNYSFLENQDPTIEDSKRYGGGVGATYWFNIKWGLDIGAEYHKGKYDHGIDDYNEMIGHSRLNHRFNPHLIGFLDYTYTVHRYDLDRRGEYKVYDGGAGFDYHFDPTMDLIMSFHYALLDPDVGNQESETPVDITLTKQFQHGSISLNGEGGYNYTSVTAETLGTYKYYEAGVTGEYAFTRHLSGDVDVLYSYRDYLDTKPSRQEDIVRAGCGLKYQLLQWLSVRAAYTHNIANSTIDSDDYVENRGSLMFTIAPLEPYRM